MTVEDRQGGDPAVLEAVLTDVGNIVSATHENILRAALAAATPALSEDRPEPADCICTPDQRQGRGHGVNCPAASTTVAEGLYERIEREVLPMIVGTEAEVRAGIAVLKLVRAALAAADSRPAEPGIGSRKGPMWTAIEDALRLPTIRGEVAAGAAGHPTDRIYEDVRAVAAADSRPAELDVDVLAEAMHVWHNHVPDGSQTMHPHNHQIGNHYRTDAAGIAAEYARLSTEADQAETPGPRTCAECGEVWPCEATVRGFDKKTPHRLASTKADQADDPDAIADQGIGMAFQSDADLPEADQAETPR